MVILFACDDFIPGTVIMSPETAVGNPWRSIFSSELANKKLALVAIDEAHCVHEWLVC